MLNTLNVSEFLRLICIAGTVNACKNRCVALVMRTHYDSINFTW
jgi:hypothetical protein